ncbi:MAG: protein tyrosine kinase [Gammaproteobacteria bacterium]|nr:protein tyrosine kinase [Gammaproteobacteria bacterium]
MGIIEKAIGRLPQQEKPEAAGPQPPRRPLPVRMGGGKTLPVADVAPVAVKALLAIEQYPALARDIRFLKRPVLARVFGMSRSTSRSGNLVMITSDTPQTGKSFISLNLGGSLASEQMTRVLLVDADPVRRTQSTRLGVDARPGLLELLAGEVAGLSEVVMPTDLPSLFVLPAGKSRPDATELFSSPRMAEFLGLLADPDLVVLLDAPPLLLTSEGRVLADLAHHTLVVVEAGRSTVSDIAATVELLKSTPAGLNIVLNKSPMRNSPRYRDYYYSY